MIRAITFDFWCTLFRDANGVERKKMRSEAFAAATGAPAENIARAFTNTEHAFYRSHIEDRKTLTPPDAVRMVCEELGAEVTPEVAEKLAQVVATAILDYPPEPIEGALDAVKAAARFGPIGIISDTGITPGNSLRQILDRYGFAPYFDTMTFSDEVGVAKPQSKMFVTTASRMRVHPSETLHIGDLEMTDILGAQHVGAQAALFAGVNSHFAETTKAEYVFMHWREFIDQLPTIMKNKTVSHKAALTALRDDEEEVTHGE